MLIPTPDLVGVKQLDYSLPDPRMVEVELWLGSKPVATGLDVGTLALPPVVSSLSGRLVFRDRWGSSLRMPSRSVTRNLASKDSGPSSKLTVVPLNRAVGLGLSVETGWRNSRMRMQSSDDLLEWRDVPTTGTNLSFQSATAVPDQSRRFFRALIAAPEAPVWTTAHAADDRVNLGWTGSGECFQIEFSSNRSDLGSSPTTRSQVELTSPAVIRGLQPGTTSYFRIQSIGPSGTSPWSPVQSVATSAQPADNGRRRLLIYGSSSAAGAGDESGKGWAGRLSDQLGPGWLVVNRSVGGDTTSRLLARFDRDVAGERWDVVWIALTLSNEGILGPFPAATYAGYVQNQRLLIYQVRQLGAVPVVSTTFPNMLYGPREYAWCRQFNDQLNRWAVAGVDFMASLDDGNGRWLPGFVSADTIHPNAAGHETLFRSIPAGFLDSLLAAQVGAEDSGDAITLANDTTTANPAAFLPAKSLSDFTVSFWFKGTNISGQALCGIGPGASRIHALGGSLRYTPGIGPEIIGPGTSPSDGRWHHVALTHQAGLGRTQLFFDGARVGAIQETFASIDRFTLGGRADNAPWANAVGVSFWGFTVHRVPLSADLLSGMTIGKSWKLSADLMVPVSQWLSRSSLIQPGPPELRGTLQINSPAWQLDASHPTFDH